MFRFKPQKKQRTAEEEVLDSYNSNLSKKILNFNFIFQQDVVDDLAKIQRWRIPSDESIELSSSICAGICYWSALTLLGVEKKPIVKFIQEIYNPKKGIKHKLGVNHTNFIKQVRLNHAEFYGLGLNPFREQDLVKFKEYGGYAGKDAEGFFKRNYESIHNTSSATDVILGEGGLAVVSIQEGFNGYSPNYHDVLVLGKNPNDETYLIFDPDARVNFNTQKNRPVGIKFLTKKSRLYTVDKDYLNQNTYREKPSPGGITIGLFSSDKIKPNSSAGSED